MSAFYDRMRATADRLVKRFDQEATSVVAEMVIPDPDPLQPPVINNVATPIPAVVRGVTAAMVAADPNLLSTDLQVIMGPQGEEVFGASALSVDGVHRRVISIERIPASGTVCAVRAVVR